MGCGSLPSRSSTTSLDTYANTYKHTGRPCAPFSCGAASWPAARSSKQRSMRRAFCRILHTLRCICCMQGRRACMSARTLPGRPLCLACQPHSSSPLHNTTLYSKIAEPQLTFIPQPTVRSRTPPPPTRPATPPSLLPPALLLPPAALPPPAARPPRAPRPRSAPTLPTRSPCPSWVPVSPVSPPCSPCKRLGRCQHRRRRVPIHLMTRRWCPSLV